MNHLIFVIAIVFTLLNSVIAQDVRSGVDISAFMGQFAATANVIEETSPSFGSVTAKHQNAMAYGGRLTIWINNNFGVEGGLAYTSSSLEGEAFGSAGSLNANLLYGTGKAVLGFGDYTRFQLGAGLGVVKSSYDFLQGDSHMVGVIVAAILIPLNQQISLRLDVEDHIHYVQWDLGDGNLTQQMNQNDLILGVGFSISTGK
jgi:hypothetical protein